MTDNGIKRPAWYRSDGGTPAKRKKNLSGTRTDQGSFLRNVRNMTKVLQRQSGVLAKGPSINKKQGYTNSSPQGQASGNAVN